MLIQFSVGNFLSFKDVATLSLVASSKNDLAETNIFATNEKFRLLKSAVIYGANASGKSNLFKAMGFFKGFVLYSSKESQATEKIRVSNFKLSATTEKEPCFFEIVFIQDGIRYIYGFQVDANIVHREWLFYFPKGKKTQLFTRDGNVFNIGTHFKEGQGLGDKTRNNALFLSVVAQFNGPIAKNVLEWFKKFRIISAVNTMQYGSFTIENLKDKDFKNKVLSFLKTADLGIEELDIEERKIDPNNIPDFIRNQIKPGEPIIDYKISTSHKKYDKDNNFISMEPFDLGHEESEGTKKFFELSGPILDSLKKSYILAVDELDSKLHPLLVQFIIKLFNSDASNSANAQLIFASHGTSLLHRRLMRRDQIWFTEKNKYGATILNSLGDYKVRKNASFEKDYMLGKYGAIPFIGDYGPTPEDVNGSK